MSANVNYSGSPRPRRKKKKKSSASSRQKRHSKVKSASRISPTGSPTMPAIRAINDIDTKNNEQYHNRRRSKDSNHSRHKKQQLQHKRYATAHASAVGNNAPHNNNAYNNNTATNHHNNNRIDNGTATNSNIHIPNRPKKKKKHRNRPKNKIKSRNRKSNAHRKARTANALHTTDTLSNQHIKSSATSPNALSVASSSHKATTNTKSRSKRTSSNPRAFRHKFEVSEMQLVVSQIADMKKSWKTPAEDVMDKIYEIIRMEERPHLNGKHCKVMLILDDDNYRVALLGNASEHVVARENLKVAFETENLYLLWESQCKKPKKRSTYGQGLDGHDFAKNSQPQPPQQDVDDMYTIQQFEHSFNDTYEFRRYDFYCMACCIFLGVILAGLGVFLYLNNEKGQDLHAMGAFIGIFGPMLAIMTGVYIGCIWYCCAVGKGKMDYYLGKNRFFGFQCKICDVCQYQYFIVVALMGVVIIAISVAAYFYFDRFVATDDARTDTQNTNPLNTNENGEIAVNEQKLFLAIEIIAGVAGISLCFSGVIVYYCCVNRKVDVRKGPSIHDDEFGD